MFKSKKRRGKNEKEQKERKESIEKKRGRRKEGFVVPREELVS